MSLLKRSCIFILLLFMLPYIQASTVKESLQLISSSDDFVELTTYPNLIIDLKYASTKNFVGMNLYNEFNKAYLHRLAAEKLSIATKNLMAINPKFKLIVFDALRPRSVQFLLWDKVKGTHREKYVANPEKGSIHNYGFAVDLSIIDENGKEMDMGTAFDDFTSLAQPLLEEMFLKKEKLSKLQIENRHLLRTVMEKAGFIQLPLEWWHFDALPKSEVKIKFKIVE